MSTAKAVRVILILGDCREGAGVRSRSKVSLGICAILFRHRQPVNGFPPRSPKAAELPDQLRTNPQFTCYEECELGSPDLKRITILTSYLVAPQGFEPRTNRL